MAESQLDILIDQNEEIVGKLDELKEAIKEIVIPETPQPLETTLVGTDELIDGLSSKIDSVIDVIRGIKIPEVDLSPIVELLKQVKEKRAEIDLREIVSVLDEIESGIKTISTGKIEKYLEEIRNEIKKIKFPEIKQEKAPDYTDYFKRIEGAIKDIRLNYSGPSSIGIRDSRDVRINPAKEETAQRALGLSGEGTDTTFTLTTQNTAYAIPTNPPNDFYTLIIYNSSDTDIYLRFTSGTTGGIKIASGASFAIDLGSGQQVYVYCGSANKTINLSYKII
jgi:hypothetical protein